MQVAILGTGAIAQKHAEAYRNIGFDLVACSNRTEGRGREFAERWQTEFIADFRDLCCYPGLDYVDVCAFPNFHIEPVMACAEIGRAVLLQKPMAADLATAGEIVRVAREAKIVLGVVSQHRFDDAILFLRRALDAGRLGRLLQADAYVKWFREEGYYARPGKGSWGVEGGGALINQAIHQADLLLALAGPVEVVSGSWQLGARHAIEAEDVVNAWLKYRSGATGVIQAATAFWPGSPERVELHGTRGAAIITGDRLTSWEAMEDEAANRLDPAPVVGAIASGASDPMAIGLISFERQFLDFAQAVRAGGAPVIGAEEGYRALELVTGIYQSCREGQPVRLTRSR